MNRSAVSGFLVAAAVLWFGVIHPAARPTMFLDSHALILVIGGTIAAALIAFPIRQLFSLVDMLVLATLFPKRKDLGLIAGEILGAAHLFRSGQMDIANFQPSHGFVREGVKLLVQPDIDTEEIEKILRKRAATYRRRYQLDAKVLNSLAKFPPAFGLLGASTGMIEMMANLGKGGGTEAIGSAMAIALVATFWGIAAANLVILPLADHANKIVNDDQFLRELVIEGLLCIRRGDSEKVLVETLRSFLPVDRRKDINAFANFPLNFPSANPPSEDTEVTVTKVV